MNNNELKEALFNGREVVLHYPGLVSMSESEGISCKCVSAVIYRVKDGKLLVSAELTGKNGKSVIYAKAENVSYKEEAI